MSLREILVFCGLVLVWGFHYVVLKTGVSEIPATLYAALRMTLVAVLAAPFLRWRKGEMGRIFAAGLCLGGVNYAFLLNGVRFAPASAAAVAIELYVPFATILSILILKEHVGWRRLAGIGVAFAGVMLVALSRKTSGGGDHIGLGVGLVAGCAAAESLGAIFVKQAKGFRPHELLAWFALIGSIFLWGLSAILDGPPGPHLAAARTSVIVSTVIYSAVGASMFGHTAYYWLLQRLPLSQVAVSTLMTTMFGVLFSVAFLHERLSPQFLVGGVMVLGGVGFVLLRAAKKKALPAEPGALEPIIVDSPLVVAASYDAQPLKRSRAMEIIEAPSPNHDARSRAVDMVVLHYTGMRSGAEALARLRDPAAAVSAHYLVEEDGRVFHLVPEDRRAWHAGLSSWRGEGEINARSIGIEIVNPGHEWGYRPFPDRQIDAVIALLKEISERHKIAPARIVGHSDIAPGRKEDPGELFPWARLAAEGLAAAGIYEGAPDVSLSFEEALGLLKSIGYEIAEAAPGKPAPAAVILAFQRRFCPRALGQGLDPRTKGAIRWAVAQLLG